MDLIHLTGHRSNWKPGTADEEIQKQSPQERLESILRGRSFIPSTTFYSDHKLVVCFTETDLDSLAETVREKGHAPWGILLDRDVLRDQGVKRVRYCRPEDVTDVEAWRVVSHNPDEGVDWSWEREWRWHGTDRLHFTTEAVTGLLVGDDCWPELEVDIEHNQLGSIPYVAVPEWVQGIGRFVWRAGKFVRIGPREL